MEKYSGANLRLSKTRRGLKFEGGGLKLQISTDAMKHSWRDHPNVRTTMRIEDIKTAQGRIGPNGDFVVHELREYRTFSILAPIEFVCVHFLH